MSILDHVSLSVSDYAAFVLHPDGHDIEAVFHGA
jgi:hypothetical protein